MTKLTPQFRRVLTDAQKGLEIKPILRAYLFEAQFPPRFEVVFDKPRKRKPDGWFHPSTHPLLEPRQLYYYLVAPDVLIPEPMEYMGTLSVTMGTALHSFIQMCLIDAGDLVDEDVPVADERTGARGEMDGVRSDGSAFEFKTSVMSKLRRVDDLDVEGFRKVWPTYWAQAQEYLRLSGRQRMMVCMLGLGYPWEMREFHIHADPQFHHTIREKYLQVRQDVADQRLPMACCAPNSATAKQCFARQPCPVGIA